MILLFEAVLWLAMVVVVEPTATIKRENKSGKQASK